MSAQLARIVADLERIKCAFDFTRDGFGEKVAETTAAAIFEFMDAEVDPDNRPWQPLSPAYAARKAQVAPGNKMSELYLKMKDPAQLKGEPSVSPGAMTQTYGTDEDARREAVWFQEGNDRQPARPFYALNDLALTNLAALFDERFHDAVNG